MPGDPKCVKVCLVTGGYPPDPGGLARSAERLVGYLRARGFRVHVLAAANAPGCEFPDGAVTVHRIPIDPRGRARDGFAINQAVWRLDEAERFDLFHGFFLPLAYPCILAAARGRRPVIASLRGSDAVDWLAQRQDRLVVASVLERAQWITSVNISGLAALSGIRDIAGRSSVIPNAIDAASYPEWRPTYANRGVVGTVAQFQRVKNAPLLVQSYARLPRELRRRLVLVGGFPDSAEKDRILRTVGDCAVETETVTTGAVAHCDIPGFLLSMRVFVQCSAWEGFPNSLLEAAAAGVPIVASAVGGMRDFLSHGDNALLTPPDDECALAQAIATVLADENLASGLSCAGRRWAAQFRPASEETAWIDLYRKILQRP